RAQGLLGDESASERVVARGGIGLPVRRDMGLLGCAGRAVVRSDRLDLVDVGRIIGTAQWVRPGGTELVRALNQKRRGVRNPLSRVTRLTLQHLEHARP